MRSCGVLPAILPAILPDKMLLPILGSTVPTTGPVLSDMDLQDRHSPFRFVIEVNIDDSRSWSI